MTGGLHIEHGHAGQRDGSCLGEMGQEGVSFHHTTQEGVQFKT